MQLHIWFRRVFVCIITGEGKRILLGFFSFLSIFSFVLFWFPCLYRRIFNDSKCTWLLPLALCHWLFLLKPFEFGSFSRNMLFPWRFMAIKIHSEHLTLSFGVSNVFTASECIIQRFLWKCIQYNLIARIRNCRNTRNHFLVTKSKAKSNNYYVFRLEWVFFCSFVRRWTDCFCSQSREEEESSSWELINSAWVIFLIKDVNFYFSLFLQSHPMLCWAAAIE